MSILYSSDFQHPDTGIPVCFMFDEEQETLSLEPCEHTCDEWGVSTMSESYSATATACRRWGSRSCSSAAEANRIIRDEFPDAWTDEVFFDEE